MKDLNKISILGAGRSGTGAAVLAAKKGLDVFVSDFASINGSNKDLLNTHNIKFEEGRHTKEIILDSDAVVISPGISWKVPIVKEIRDKNIPLLSEIEFASNYTNATKICVTGTNGKTTTSSLIYHVLAKAGYNVSLSGNIGESFALQVATDDTDYYVLELSSFMLDAMYEFKADIAVLLNITPDHLDRYENFEAYVASKFRITQNQTGDDAFIYCADDEVVTNYIEKSQLNGKQYPFSTFKSEGVSAYLDESNIVFNHHSTKPLIMSVYDLALQGRHNLYNSMAAGIAARILDIRKDIIRESFADFQSVEHRLEFVNTVHGIEFVNDSKATNVNSTWYALESQQKPVVWIAGGVDKGNNYKMLQELVSQKVKAIICLGKDNKRIVKAFKEVVPVIIETESAESAVEAAYSVGKKGDVVLLSPACASFDLFKNFEDRGDQFKNAVRAL